MPKNKQKKQKKQQKENNKQINNENNENNENTVESGCPECDGCLAKQKYDIATKALENNDTFVAEKMLLEASKHIIKLIHSDEFSDIENTDSVIELYKSICLNLQGIYYIRIFTSTTSLDVDIYKLLASTYLLAANKYEPRKCNCLKCIVKQN